MTPREICEDFARRHAVVFDDEGECGFGRKCVGFCRGTSWVSYNPYRYPDFDAIEELQCDAIGDCRPSNAYHKYDCLAVLGRDDEAIEQLAMWVTAIEALGDVEIVEYSTGATGVQQIFTGSVNYAIVVRERADAGRA